jgi:uncharacterized membrane protein required for colicin V production
VSDECRCRCDCNCSDDDRPIGCCLGCVVGPLVLWFVLVMLTWIVGIFVR